MMNHLPTLLGFIGCCLVILTYTLCINGKLDARGVPNLAGNLVGQILLLISLMYNFNLGSFVIECFLILVTLVTLLRRLRRQSKKIARRYGNNDDGVIFLSKYQ